MVHRCTHLLSLRGLCISREKKSPTPGAIGVSSAGFGDSFSKLDVLRIEWLPTQGTVASPARLPNPSGFS